ncbi:MAG: hypothetical protein R3250_00120 [Melioribacteraceae bacterium]|nr:hypothetical protein [Melioribacteraceae bacterium]
MNLEDCGILREDILNGIVNKFYDELYDDISHEADRLTREKVDEIVGQKVEEKVNCAIEKRIDELMNEQYQPVDCWGQKIRKPTTISEVLKNSFENWWSQKVDSRGNPSTSYGSSETRAEYLTKKVASEVLSGALREDFNGMVKASKNEMKKSIANAITKILDKEYK